ncbi:MAG: TonB-dependent receptor [Bacteroidetes bacterium]|nr:TonB-dependent receptor [Bacteroidota bacterium]
MKQTFLLVLFSCLFTVFSFAQVVEITGFVTDDSNKLPIEGVTVTAAGSETMTDASGKFFLKPRLRGADLVVYFYKEGFIALEKAVDLKSHATKADIGTVSLSHEPSAKEFVTDEDRIPIITLSSDDDSDLGDQNISGILSASRDPFVNAASFNLSTGGFEIRGYDSETPTLFNGILVNNLETGSVYWSTWGGLNDVTRNRESTIDLSPSSYSFGGVGGAASIDTRASEQRVGKRISYMYGNRSYAGRVMATWNTGMLPSGWAFSFSGSRRWAEEGYVPGTFYDAWSYFGSIDRKLNKKHMLNLTVAGSPVKRGAAGTSIQEVNDLAGTNFYNPNWGWQDGRKRNSRVVDAHQPFGVLRHDWTINEKSNLTTSLGFLTGHYGRTQLDWFNAPDPRPDYYRKLPVYYNLPGNGGPTIANQVAEVYRNNPDLLQVQWDEIYEGNRLNGQSYNGTPGNMSQVILGDQRSNLTRLSGNTIYQNFINDHLAINAGLSFQQEKTHYFATVEDLLGGDYYPNVDHFALDTPIPGQSPEYNLNDPDPIVRQGDTYKWDYDITGRRADAWAQAQFSFRKLDFFLAGDVSRTDFWRTGHYRNGRFPNSSYGDSEVKDYFNYGTKGGITYKLNGRNYFYANGAFLNRAPDIRTAYASPRSRDQLVPGLQNEEVLSGEVGYLLRAPRLKARATFYMTQFNNGLKLNRFFFTEDVTRFGTSILVGADKRHTGVELAAQAKLTPSLTLSGVAAVGEYVYTSRPRAIFVIDDDGQLNDRGIVYAKNFYVPSTPQTAYSATLDYRSPKFWSASITFNYFDRNYLDFSPFRRTVDAVFGLEQGSQLYNSIVDQQKAPSAYTVDIFANKSFKVNDDIFFSLTLGITNLLNAEVITGGFEQLRFDSADFTNDVNVYPPKYFYAYGTNFFLMGALRF